MPDLPRDIGATLSNFRIKAQLSQSSLARRMGVDQSKISRMESGEQVVSISEVTSYLTAIDTSGALSYMDYLAKAWHCVSPAPTPDNPDLEAIWLAEQCLGRLQSIEQNENPSRLVRAEIEMHRQSIIQSTEQLNRSDYKVAFIGNIGVGKTTALCLAAGLVLQDSATLTDRIVLETGAGRTTLCEVHVKRGPAWGVVVEPHPDSEIYKYVGEFCDGLMPANNPKGSETSEKGVSREIDRALRNMAQLNRRPKKGQDGKRVTEDPALELANECGSLDDVRSAVTEKMTLWKRTTREIWYDRCDGPEPLKWLRDTFVKINNGRVADVSLPKRIDIIVPDPLIAESPFTISFVDTRGVDCTALRPDLKACLDDPRTCVVLCSSFNSAPDDTMLRFMEHAIETGSDRLLSDKVLVLALPRPTEAQAMKDDSGDRADSDEYGYDLKRDQVQDVMNKLGVHRPPILFFNSSSDRPHALRQQLLENLSRLRSVHSHRLTGLKTAVDNLIANHTKDAAEREHREVTKRLSIFIAQHELLPERLRRAHEELIYSVRNLSPRSVWATTRRQGSWYNLDVCYYIGTGAGRDAKRRAQPIFTELDSLLSNILGDPDLATAHDFVREVKENSKGWEENFLEAARFAGQETFRPPLQDARGLWAACERRWKQGPGYRDDVAVEIRDWFDSAANEHFHIALEARVQGAWNLYALMPLRTLCDEVSGRTSSNVRPSSLFDAFEHLVAQGRRQGFLTYGEISEILYKRNDFNPHQFDELLDRFIREGIEIVDEVRTVQHS